ncbi:MAG: bifunctional 4-hydroxy-2-oxoglutarate aldolase/2-dehydro-3-deoxy-phosphogluconate aldolase [Sediminicola sp.]
MAQFTRSEVITLMQNTGLVPLFYHPDLEICQKVVKACYDGGARLLEFTARGDGAHEVFAGLIKYSAKNLPGMCLGVGSLTDVGAASLYMQMGANFIVTPSFRDDIAIACNRRKVLWCPGCGTITEINRAEERGCEIVKLFPGEMYGPGMISAIKGPQPWTNIMPTGGVTTEEDNLRSWFDAGATCVGIGSGLITKELLALNDYAGIQQEVNKALKLIEGLLGELSAECRWRPVKMVQDLR